MSERINDSFFKEVPKCKNPYISYTVRNYARCYGILDDESIEKFDSFFTQLKSNRIVEKNKFIDSGINSGYSMVSVGQRKRINEESSRELMTALSNIIDTNKPTSDTDIAFLKSMLSLIDAMAYVEVDELFPLNNLFSDIGLFKHDLFGPYDDFYYTKKKSGVNEK